jgi:sterol 3beta-glucosyltransferase
MRITILTVGSRGDVQPYVALGVGLRAAGHEVRLATHEPFREFVSTHGLEFAPLGADRRGWHPVTA